MTHNNPKGPSLKEVLGYFAVEDSISKATLDRYLKEFPEYANELIDAAFEFQKTDDVDTTPLGKVDLDRIEVGRKRFLAASSPRSQDLLSSVKVSVQREAAKAIELPRTVVSGLLERRVIIGTVPQKFLQRFLQALGMEEAVFRSSYEDITPIESIAFSYSADVKPKPSEQIAFEKFLRDAGVSAEKIAKIHKEG